jgi:hypothetical protein
MVRFLALVQPAKGIEGYFKGLSQPVSGMDLPTGATLSPPDFASLLALAAQHGVKFLTPKEIADYGFRGPKPWEADQLTG